MPSRGKTKLQSSLMPEGGEGGGTDEEKVEGGWPVEGEAGEPTGIY